MTKREQIEEMTKFVEQGFKNADCRQPYTNIPYPYFRSQIVAISEALYNAGYRKGNKEKNCWECIESKRVTSDDYAKLQEQFADYQLASEKAIRAHEELTKAFERNMKSVLEIEKENVRKETAKEIISFIESKDKIGGKYSIYTKLLQEVKEKYGEVEE